MEPSIGQRRALMAQMLNLDPNQPSRWPITLLDRLICLELWRGEEALQRELWLLMTPPATTSPPSPRS